MSEDYLTARFTVDQTPHEVFAAINNVRGWWTGDLDGVTDQIGAEFTYRSGDVHRSRQQVTALVPGERVAWHVVDSHLSFTADPAEWIGTDITFDIARRDDTTEVRFTHVGLAADHECFEACSGAWNFYVTSSLRDLIVTGQGDPGRAAASEQTA